MDVPDTESVASGGSTLNSENSALQAKLDLIQKQLELVTSKLAKGKGRGKKSQPSATPSTGAQETRPGLLNRLRTSFSGPSTSRNNQDCSDQASVSSNSIADDEPPPAYSDIVERPQARGTKKKTIYIKNVQLLLNGVGLDQIETEETEGDNLFCKTLVIWH